MGRPGRIPFWQDGGLALPGLRDCVFPLTFSQHPRFTPISGSGAGLERTDPSDPSSLPPCRRCAGGQQAPGLSVTTGSYPEPAGCLTQESGSQRMLTLCPNLSWPGPPLPLKAKGDSHLVYLQIWHCCGQEEVGLWGAGAHLPTPPALQPPWGTHRFGGKTQSLSLGC